MSMMGKINNFLGLNIRQRREGIFINQEKYTKNLLEKFGLTNSTKHRVPMAVGTKLTPSLDSHTVDLTMFRSMIGSLLYLTASTTSLGLWYPSKSGFYIQAFTDSDLGGCAFDRKITSGGYQLLDGKLVSWQSKKQTCVAISTAEAEYISATS
ncbi:uncharacterized mitochondrial protein AtMg00810-like [Lactuca sativa]|uniref:uncharacterized mitochondrial protein AtMg00810-like n=1 Tax=Lactuca sativa TaxID=4236 RepID=UPI0022AF435B|nr:uncharacterized mitochondrial protein AtMg00810-like [Lactuca sativa]